MDRRDHASGRLSRAGAAILVLCGLLVAATPAAAQRADPRKRTEAESNLPPVPEDLPVRVELGLGFANHVPSDGFTSVVVDLSAIGPSAPSTVDLVTVQAIDGGNVLVRLGPALLQGAARRRLVGVVPSRLLGESGGLLVSATDAAGRLVGQATVFPVGDRHGLRVAEGEGVSFLEFHVPAGYTTVRG